MSLAGSQQKVFLRLLAALRPNWHSDVNLPAGIAELFTVMVTGDDVSRSKPDPEAYIACLRSLRATPAECIAFEDSEVGIAAAKAAGIPVLPVTFHA